MIAGVDMYHKKFLAVIEDDEGRRRIEIFDTFGELLGRDNLDHIVIDVPIGLPESGSRSCDVLARKFVGKRRSSVFPAPIRPMLSATTYEDAKSACQRANVSGKGCSLQAYGIMPVVRAVDAHMTADLQQRIREGHPEVSFTALAGAPMSFRKLSPEGRKERLGALRQHFGDVLPQLEGLKSRGAVTDAIDAYALLFTARRICNRRADAMPSVPETDARGLCMEIVF